MPSRRTDVSYAKPPVTEAVIELRSDELLDVRELERCRDRFRKTYPTVEAVNNISVQFDADKVTHKASLVGFKMTSADAVDVVLINSFAIGTSRLAPYPGWENLAATAKANYELLLKVVGRKRIVRIGTRFLNRIDIPNHRLGTPPSWPSFVKVIPSLPAEVASGSHAYYMNVQASSSTGAKIIIQTGVSNPVLLDHTSVQLDIDSYYDTEIPQRMDDVWNKLDTLRQFKNAVFENCITEATRELFR
jgi:uncharacterized protein (TIGR04255 family)